MKSIDRQVVATSLGLLLAAGSPEWSRGDEVEQAIAAIARVGPGASGSPEARAARDQLARHSAEILPRLLVAMDTTNIVAANWYRTVFDEIAARELARPEPRLPRDAITEFLLDARRSGRARRLALNLLEHEDPKLRAQLLGNWLEDREFRRDAVDHLIRHGDQAKDAGKTEPAIAAYERAFAHARDADQVRQLVSQLKALGKVVDPIAHLGFVIHWHLIGPFPAERTSGFQAVFPPEQQVDLVASYPGVDGRKLSWKPFTTADLLGEINLIQAIGPAAEAVGYAYAELEAAEEQPAQLRCSADDNLTVWLNGERVLAREQWLNGTRLDRFTTNVTMRKGVNRVLVKICQGPRHVNPEVSNNWSFQLRFCDETGGAVRLRAVEKGPRT